MTKTMNQPTDIQKPKRRAKGTGTIEREPDGRGGIQYRARFPFEPGKRDVVGTYPTHEDADRALEAILIRLAEKNGGVRGRPLAKVVEKMLVQRRANGYASVGTEEDDWDSYFAKHALAERPVQALTEGEVLDAISSFRGRTKRNKGLPLAIATRKKLLNIVRAALYVAKQDELVERNVLSDTSIADPKGKAKRAKRKRRALKWDQYTALQAASKAALEIDAAIWSGCRQGELRALHFTEVHNVVDLSCTCEEHRKDPHIHILYGKPPKKGEDCSPKNGEPRCVSLFGRGLAVFERLVRDRKTNQPIVFVSRLRSYRAKGRLVGRKQWGEWRAAAGLVGFRWQDLRHTCGTWLARGEIRMGIDRAWPLEAIKEHLGHAEIKTTEIYADQRDGEQARQAAERARGSRPETSHQEIAELLSRLRDLNSRPTVYEGECKRSFIAKIDALEGYATAFGEAISAESPLAIAKGLSAMDAALEVVRDVRAAVAASSEREVAS